MRIIKSVVVVAVLFSGAAAYAQESMTRDEVVAELARAQAADELGTVGEAWDGSAALQAKELGMYGRSFSEATTAPDPGASLPEEIKQQMVIDFVGGD